MLPGGSCALRAGLWNAVSNFDRWAVLLYCQKYVMQIIWSLQAVLHSPLIPHCLIQTPFFLDFILFLRSKTYPNHEHSQGGESCKPGYLLPTGSHNSVELIMQPYSILCSALLAQGQKAPAPTVIECPFWIKYLLSSAMTWWLNLATKPSFPWWLWTLFELLTRVPPSLTAWLHGIHHWGQLP